MNEGPAIEELTRHLAECPEIFLGEPIQKNGAGDVHVAAVFQDLFKSLGGQALDKNEIAKLEYKSQKKVKEDRNRLRLVLISLWLCHNNLFREVSSEKKLRKCILNELAPLAKLVSAEKFVSEPERREELARFLLAGAGCKPFGESDEEAENRFDALSSVKREAVIKAAQVAEKRARELREELARKERERRAASVYSHE